MLVVKSEAKNVVQHILENSKMNFNIHRELYFSHLKECAIQNLLLWCRNVRHIVVVTEIFTLPRNRVDSWAQFC